MIDILIPTHNRAESLHNNLNQLAKLIREECPDCSIVVSDNASRDNTKNLVQSFKKENKDVSVRYHRNESNIGLEKNALLALELAQSEYAMFLGDDDYLPQGYLKFCITNIESNDNIGTIMPAKAKLLEDGSLIQNSDFVNHAYPSGFQTALKISHHASQMSGLLLYSPKELLKIYTEGEYKSIYLFIFFFTHNILKYKSILANEFIVKVTSFNEKDWDYNSIGLLDEIFNAYYLTLDSLSERQVRRLIVKFVRIHGWRFGIEVGKPILSIKRFMVLMKFSKRIAWLNSALFIQFLREYFYRLRN